MNYMMLNMFTLSFYEHLPPMPVYSGPRTADQVISYTVTYRWDYLAN